MTEFIYKVNNLLNFFYSKKIQETKVNLKLCNFYTNSEVYKIQVQYKTESISLIQLNQ
jgi:hypothetical protein